MNLRFETIDLETYGALAVEFRRDSYVTSFGSDEAFVRMGPDAYTEWLRHRILAYPELHVHVWLGAEVVGQIEARPSKADSQLGLVNLFYVKPCHRRLGVGGALDTYVGRVFMKQGRSRLQLSVSPSNQPAWAFYRRRGYRYLGPQKDAGKVHRMERQLALHREPTAALRL